MNTVILVISVLLLAVNADPVPSRINYNAFKGKRFRDIIFFLTSYSYFSLEDYMNF